MSVKPERYESSRTPPSRGEVEGLLDYYQRLLDAEMIHAKQDAVDVHAVFIVQSRRGQLGDFRSWLTAPFKPSEKLLS